MEIEDKIDAFLNEDNKFNKPYKGEYKNSQKDGKAFPEMAYPENWDNEKRFNIVNKNTYPDTFWKNGLEFSKTGKYTYNRLLENIYNGLRRYAPNAIPEFRERRKIAGYNLKDLSDPIFDLSTNNVYVPRPAGKSIFIPFEDYMKVFKWAKSIVGED